MIDSHCHLDHEPLSTNLNDVILRSKNDGIFTPHARFNANSSYLKNTSSKVRRY